jgi:hypothetical protein
MKLCLLDSVMFDDEVFDGTQGATCFSSFCLVSTYDDDRRRYRVPMNLGVGIKKLALMWTR